MNKFDKLIADYLSDAARIKNHIESYTDFNEQDNYYYYEKDMREVEGEIRAGERAKLLKEWLIKFNLWDNLSDNEKDIIYDKVDLYCDKIVRSSGIISPETYYFYHSYSLGDVMRDGFKLFYTDSDENIGIHRKNFLWLIDNIKNCELG